MAIVHFIGGLVLLVLGGRLLVGAAAELARRLGVPSLLIGLTIVAWGTSAPELAFNLTAAFGGKPDLVFGNVVGANICNLGLVLGASAPLAVPAMKHAVVTLSGALASDGATAMFGQLLKRLQRLAREHGDQELAAWVTDIARALPGD